jgi:hypothetical protein
MLESMPSSSNQYAFYTAAIGALYIIRHPVFTQKMTRYFNHDVIGGRR